MISLNQKFRIIFHYSKLANNITCNEYYILLQIGCCSIAAAQCTIGYFVYLLFTSTVRCTLLLPCSYTSRLLSRWRISVTGSYP